LVGHHLRARESGEAFRRRSSFRFLLLEPPVGRSLVNGRPNEKKVNPRLDVAAWDLSASKRTMRATSRLAFSVRSAASSAAKFISTCCDPHA
jgi:hypothetical protein